jgi:hypothetical protein
LLVRAASRSPSRQIATSHGRVSEQPASFEEASIFERSRHAQTVPSGLRIRIDPRALQRMPAGQVPWSLVIAGTGAKKVGQKWMAKARAGINAFPPSTVTRSEAQ